MIGQSAPTSDVARFAEQITGLARRVRELELTKRPFIQAGSWSGTSDSNGLISVTFPVEFASTPVVQAVYAGAQTVTVVSAVRNVTTTGFDVQISSIVDGALLTSTTRNGTWIAVAA